MYVLCTKQSNGHTSLSTSLVLHQSMNYLNNYSHAGQNQMATSITTYITWALAIISTIVVFSSKSCNELLIYDSAVYKRKCGISERQ